jgi:hypothetical protein
MSYYNLPSDSIENDLLYLEYLTEAGPRIVRLIYKPANINLLAEAPGAKLKSPHGEYSMHGGHRFWAAPESPEFTYIPDDSGLTVEKGNQAVCLVGAVEAATGLQKMIDVRLAENTTSVELQHTLTNKGSKPVACALWTLTMLPAGGLATMPLRGEPGSKFLPDRQISFWPYTRFNDPRLDLMEDELQVEASYDPKIFKVGARCPRGWITYFRQGITFKKQFPFDGDAHYSDMGCNAEIYTDGVNIELESLGGLVQLPPGDSIHQTETWEISETN